jgi:hypothetical protein
MRRTRYNISTNLRKFVETYPIPHSPRNRDFAGTFRASNVRRTHSHFPWIVPGVIDRSFNPSPFYTPCPQHQLHLASPTSSPISSIQQFRISSNDMQNSKSSSRVVREPSISSSRHATDPLGGGTVYQKKRRSESS